ncbi:MAG: putative bifunctional diguanylate cyclase/phosphodiesterase [Granulosicoccus sp.]
MLPFGVGPAGKAGSAYSNTPITEIAVAFVNDTSEIVSANQAFFRAIQCNGHLENNLADYFSERYPYQQANIAERFACREASQTLLCLPAVAPLHLTLSRIEEGQRVVQVAVQTGETDALDGQIYTDPLTGLGNRRLLDHVIAQQTSHTKPLAMLVMDLDRFKQINDTLGHFMGDKLLELVSKRTQRATRDDDVIVRMGGDEFIILHEAGDSTSPSAQQIASRLVDMMSRPFLIDGHQLNISASIGIAILNEGTDKVQDLFRHADLALYRAKDSGRNNYQVFVKELEEIALARRELEIHLRRALSLKEFSLVYQPQVDMPEGSLTGFEALIRWNSSELGLITPDEFIPLAEETGEIHSIGDWVLQSACLDAMNWDDHLTVAVNVSAIQFTSDRFVGSVKQALKKSGLPAHRLEIEITETVLISNPEQTLKHLLAIRDMGISIAMDDFGTGYSSLSYLNSFPFSKIKIDRAFVSQEQTAKTKALVDAIINLGTSLGMKTLAEGVETKEQFDHLSQSGCVAAQGYLISRPIPSEDIDSYIRDNHQPQNDIGNTS